MRTVKGRDAFPRPLLAELCKLGALDTCTVVSWAEPWEAPLGPTLEELVIRGYAVDQQGDAYDDVILVCRPGRLAFLQTHDPVHQVIYRPS